MSDTELTIYCTSWCGGCSRARRLLDRHQIPYHWIDIDQDKEGEKFVKDAANGFRSVPTIAFPDGSVLVEPPLRVLAEKLGVEV